VFVLLHEEAESGNRVYTEYIKVPLDSGSLLIMQGAIQDDWQVRWIVPKLHLLFCSVENIWFL